MTRSILKTAMGAAMALTASALIAGEITLFESPGFQGRRMTLRNAVSDFDRTSFNDRAESIIVRDGVWEVCTDARFAGRCVRLQPGEYPNLQGPLNDRISSAREVAYAPPPPAPPVYGQPGPACGARTILYSGPDFRGRPFELDRN